MFAMAPGHRLRVASLFLILMMLGCTAGRAAPAVPGERIRSAHQIAHDQALGYRIHGKVSAVDPVAKTFSIANKAGSRTIAVVRETVVIKNGAAAKFANIALGDEADGIATMVLGKFTAISVRFGPFRDLPYGTPVPDKPGYVISPYSPRAGYVDVTGMPAGMEAKDPYSGKIFLVPR